MNIKPSQFVIREIMYSGHLQSLGAASISFASAKILGININLGIILVPYLIFQAIYFFDRYHDLSIDKATNMKRTKHINAYAHLIPLILVIILGFVSGWLIKYAHIYSLLLAAVVSALGFLYPVWFKNITKKIPLFKNIYVASVFAAMIFFPTVYFGQEISFSPEMLVLLFLVFFEAIIMQIILDMKDFSIDTTRGLRTLPVIVGVNRAFRNISVFSVAVFLFVLIVSPTGLISFLAFGSLLVNLFSIWRIYNKKADGYIIVAAKFLAWPMLLMFA